MCGSGSGRRDADLESVLGDSTGVGATQDRAARCYCVSSDVRYGAIRVDVCVRRMSWPNGGATLATAVAG